MLIAVSTFFLQAQKYVPKYVTIEAPINMTMEKLRVSSLSQNMMFKEENDLNPIILLAICELLAKERMEYDTEGHQRILQQSIAWNRPAVEQSAKLPNIRSCCPLKITVVPGLPVTMDLGSDDDAPMDLVKVGHPLNLMMEIDDRMEE